MTTHVLARLELKYDSSSVPRFVEIMSHAKPGLAAAGWVLVGSWTATSGRVYEVVDLWKVDGFDKAQHGVLAEFARNPELAEWIGRLSEIVESEHVQLLTSLDW